jgi:hypothetical protein
LLKFLSVSLKNASPYHTQAQARALDLSGHHLRTAAKGLEDGVQFGLPNSDPAILNIDLDFGRRLPGIGKLSAILGDQAN